MARPVISRRAQFIGIAVVLCLAIMSGCGNAGKGDSVQTDDLKGLSTPAEAITFFSSGDPATDNGEPVDAKLLKMLKTSSWSDDGAALGSALRLATAGSLDNRQASAKIAGQAIHIIAGQKRIASGARNDIGLILASYAGEIQRIVSSSAPAGDTGLSASADDIAAVIKTMSNDNTSAPSSVLAALIVHRETTVTSALNEHAQRQSDAPKTAAALAADADFLAALNAGGRQSGPALAFVLKNTDAAKQHQRMMTTALNAANNFLFAAPNTALTPLVGQQLTNLSTVVRQSANQATDVPAAFAATIFDTLLRNGYLGTANDPKNGLGEAALDTPSAAGPARINPKLYNGTTGDLPTAAEDTYNTWIAGTLGGAPLNLATDTITGYKYVRAPLNK